MDFSEEDQIPLEILAPYKKYKKMIEDGQINEAENQLMDSLNANDNNDFLLGLAFYDQLNRMSNDFLENHDYSRQEVDEGVIYLTKMYGYDSLVEAIK